MIIELIFKDGTGIRLLESSSLIPSSSIYVRNQFRVHVIDGNVASFVEVFSNKYNLDEMTFIGYFDDGETVAFRHDLKYYNIVSDIGRKLFEMTNASTGETISYYNLVAVLEQPTPIERQEPIIDPEAEEVIDILMGVEE